MSVPPKNGKKLTKTCSPTKERNALQGSSATAEHPALSSAGYAERLSCGHHRGLLNLKAEPDGPLIIKYKVSTLARMIKDAKCIIVHTGAGLSTAAGINDFRGPDGIWTTEVKKMSSDSKAISIQSTTDAASSSTDEARSRAIIQHKKRDDAYRREADSSNELEGRNGKRRMDDYENHQATRRSKIGKGLVLPNYNDDSYYDSIIKQDEVEERKDRADSVRNKNASKSRRTRRAARSEQEKYGDFELVEDESDTELTYSEAAALKWDDPPPKKTATVETAHPTLAHIVIAKMYQDGLVDTVITQNVDNLHARSGIPRERLAELHGNVMVEWCKRCKREYERDYEVQSAGFKQTGHKCSACGHPLTDKVLDWNGELPEEDERRALSARRRGDLHIVVGSSCQMNPSKDYPFKRGHRRQSVIINLSRTSKDADAGLIIRARADTVFALLARELRLGLHLFVRDFNLTLATRVSPLDRVSGHGAPRRLRVGLHTERGADDEKIAMRIPFVSAVRYVIFDEKLGPFQPPDCLACDVNVGCDASKQPVHIKARVWLVDGRFLDMSVNYVGRDVLNTQRVPIDPIKYGQLRDYEIGLIDRKAAEHSCNWAHVLKDARSWFMHAEKRWHLECVVCGTVIFGGGPHWAKNSKQHLEDCLKNALGQEARAVARATSSHDKE